MYRTYWIEYALLKLQPLPFAWRFPQAFQAVFLFIIVLAANFMPETPRHLSKTGRLEEAREIIGRCRLRPSEAAIEQEMAEIQEAIRIEATLSAHGFLSMIWKKDKLHTRRRVALAMGVQCMNKLCGPDAIAAYGPTIFALSGCKFVSSGFRPTSSLITVLTTSLWQFARHVSGVQLHLLHLQRSHWDVFCGTRWKEEIDVDRLGGDGQLTAYCWPTGATGHPYTRDRIDQEKGIWGCRGSFHISLHLWLRQYVDHMQVSPPSSWLPFHIIKTYTTDRYSHRQLGVSYGGLSPRNTGQGCLLGHGLIRHLGCRDQRGDPVRCSIRGMVGFYHVCCDELPSDHSRLVVLCGDSQSPSGRP